MTTVSINLEIGDERFIKDAIQTGRYHSESEVVADALAELKARDESREATLAAMRSDVLHGLDQLNRGEVEEWSLEEAKLAARASFAAAHR